MPDDLITVSAPALPDRVDLDTLATAEGQGEQVVAAMAAQIRDRSTRPNTAAAYGQDRTRWERYCTIAGLNPNVPSADALTVYAAWLIANPGAGVKHAAPATLRRRVHGVVASWHAQAATVPHRVGVEAMQAIAAHERWLADHHLDAGRGQAPLLTVDGLQRLVRTCPTTQAGLRDRALLLLGFGIAARRSELAGLAASDITADYHGGALRGVVVRVRSSKTGQGRTVPIARGQDRATCPAIAWLRWTQASGISCGPALRRVDRHDHMREDGLSAAAVGEVIRRVGQRTGDADLAALTGHSLRAGLATAARRAGHDVQAIARVGGWDTHSRELAKYMRIADQWDRLDNATVNIGL
ncbi:tyrosine-type recombinase/integrase [Nocardiopsis sp. JB363]|uniref:tyrosine-type recombinase/integrase n=1 Tax=Nocardiopsis sp. JB363 TaxID=1434837 RepID=UPI00097A7A7D|nr:tyrosine-type recombinase/integrase [Nocardiopsis sp. JB363]SIO86470.1 Integrase-like protein [Nocardiopsis sp. JB363]